MNPKPKSKSELDLFFKPSSVAILGASRHVGRSSFNIIEKLQEMGFKGKIYPVNPHSESIAGLKSYPGAKSLPTGIDLGIIMLQRENVPQTISESIGRGIKAFVVISEGFGEADDKGKALQSQIVQIAREHGARVIGPNSVGVVNYFSHFTSSWVVSDARTDAVTFVTQSGGFLDGFSGFTPGKAIDLGNMCDVDFVDMLGYLEDDPETKVIALHIEGLKKGREFLKAAKSAQKKKPVIVIKTGRFANAARAAQSHTGSLAGNDEVYQAAFKQAGLIQVDDVDELGDITRAFLDLPLSGGNRAAILTPSGGAGIMGVDALEKNGFLLAKLSPETIDSIKDLFPVWSRLSNPIDMMAAGINHGYKTVYERSLQALLADKNVDVVLCIAGFPTLKTIKAIANESRKPVATWVIGEWNENLLAKVKETGYRAVFSTPERAFHAMAALRDYVRRQQP